MERALPIKRETHPGAALRRAAEPIWKAVHDLFVRPFSIPADRALAAHGVGEAAGAFDPTRQIRMRWLGTAGHEITAGKTTILIDPFISRPRFIKLLFQRKLATDAALTARYFPKADYILTGHSHFDHLMDVPDIALRTGATVVGSESTRNVCAARGVPDERLIRVPPTGARLDLGDFRVRFVPSRHGRIWLGKVPTDGVIACCPANGALRPRDYRMGGAFGIWLQAGESTLYHNGSADLCDAEVEGLRADVVMMCLAGRKATPDYVSRLTGLLRPKWIVPTHYDGFFRPIEEGLSILPGVDMPGFFAETRCVAPWGAVLMPNYHEGAVFSQKNAGKPQ